MAGPSGTTGTKKVRKIHPGAALGIFPTRNDRFKKDTTRYWKGELDLDSIIAFLTHLKRTNDMPKKLIRVRGRLRNAFPAFMANKTLIRAAYAKAGWDINELSNITKRQKKAAREREQLEHLGTEMKVDGEE